MRVLVVGAGLFGSVVARQLAELNHKVDIIDKRDHVAGNCYDYEEDGIRVHKYGPHIFHTNNAKVFEYLSKYTEWVDYKHKVKCLLDDGQLVTIPPNQQTAYIIGRDKIVDKLYRPYTKKMWGLELEEIDKSIIDRVRIRTDDNELYFPDDQFQAMPKNGYTAMVENIINHENIRLTLSKSFNHEIEKDYEHIFNSMPIDEYYLYKHGALPYRSIKFHKQWIEAPKAFQYPTTNFTHDGRYTRVTEWKNYPNHGCNKYRTLVTFEEPCCYSENEFERYYPVKDIEGYNRATYRKYASINNPKTTFIGRCGLYAYLDMHQAVNAALQLTAKFH